MATITYFMVQSNLGYQLFDVHVRPLCERLGVNLRLAPADADRGYTLSAQGTSNLILWDCSVESGHVYYALTEWAKTSDAHVLVSRTPLPRNVLAENQCAPVHGEVFTNEDLGEWLTLRLPELLFKQSTRLRSPHYTRRALQRHYWMSESPADVFLSFRGSHQMYAEHWKKRFEEESSMAIRMVPKGEYAYETECVTRQQMWEIVARLQYEIRACKNRVVFWSNDYFDSFWTASELLCILYVCARNRDGSAQGAYWAPDKKSALVHPLHVGVPEFPVPEITKAQENWFWKILNNSNPKTVAPETQIPPSGLGRLTAFLLRPTMGYYDPRFTGASFWNDIRVPCPHCKPKERRPEEVDWDQHMNLDSDEEIDYFGYFSVSHEQLARGRVQCPNCKNWVRLRNERPPRTVWVPILTTEQDKSRPVIEESPVWEVITPDK
jgi:hypothetical protein